MAAGIPAPLRNRPARRAVTVPAVAVCAAALAGSAPLWALLAPRRSGPHFALQGWWASRLIGLLRQTAGLAPAACRAAPAGKAPA